MEIPLLDFSDREELRAASAQQRAFWLTNEIEPGTPAFNIPRVLQLKGAVDKDSLTRAFEGLIARHEVLRTSLVERNGMVLQYVQDQIQFALEEQDFSALSAAERRMRADAFVVQICQTAFDLAAPPNFRAALVRLADEEHLLVIVFHHVIIDGSSMGLFFDELASLYDARQSDKPAVLPDLAFQYTEFAERQQSLYAQAGFDEDIAFWKTTLSGAPPLLALPTVSPRRAVQGHRGERLAFEIDAHLTEALSAMCSRRGATLFMGLLSAFQVLLQRWADTDDVIIGTPVSGNRDEDLAPLIGCFVNTLVLRGDLSGDPTFAALLARNRSFLLDAFEHPDVPFERIVAELGGPRTRDHSPLFQVMFVMQNFRHKVPELAGLAIQEIDVDPGLAKLDLTLEVLEGDGLACSFEYDSELFDRPMMARLAAHFRRILDAVVAEPERPIGRIRLLDENEWQRAVFGWNSTACSYRERTPAAVFAAIAAERQDDVALISDGQGISFGELALRAGKVASVLRSQTADAAGPVGIFLPRSVEAFAAVLGCLIAGVPWLPLDTAQPDKRLAQLVDLADCRTALTVRALADRLPERLSTIPMDPDAPLWSEPAGAIEARSKTDLAYVLSTSGSTGVPKGVMGTTKALMNRIDWMHEAYPFAHGEVACCKTSIGFVDSVWEMLGALLAGVPTVIVPDEIVLDPETLITLLERHGVTRIVLVPTLLGVLLDCAPDLGRRLPLLGMWSISGEVLAPDLVRRFKLACPGRMLVNLYGSSEVAADVLVHEVQDADVNGTVPIGRPLANTQVYILDRTGQPAPIGLPGMLHVGGACLALGYWNKPDLTAERFKANPIAGAPSPLLFDTGDRGVWREDGTILYLGRTDSQVKLRGVRLELGEILAALRSHAAVREAATVIVGDPDQPRLVAFVVGSQAAEAPDPGALRAYLQERLPPAAVPARLLVVDELPLLPSGKVDQITLRSLADTSSYPEAARDVIPVNADVAQIWRAVLGEDNITADDDFFHLGGNSLLAMQVTVRVRHRFGIDLPIRTLFDNPILAAFAKAVEAAPPAQDGALTEISPRPRSRTELNELRNRLARLSPEELDALIRNVRDEMH
jgi:amino acid adenylation domain-containing protein